VRLVVPAAGVLLLLYLFLRFRHRNQGRRFIRLRRVSPN